MEGSSVLQKFDNDKLIDVVKNYKRYNYDDEIRDTAIHILCERGWTMDELAMFGYLENHDYNEAERQYNAFRRNSKIGICFLVLSGGMLAIIYIFFLFLSFRNQRRFYKALRRDSDNSYFNVGMLFSQLLGVMMYFHVRDKMKEELKGVR